MKRAVLVAVAVAAIVGGIDVLADLTQDRPDKVLPGSRSEILLSLETRDRRGTDLLAAEGLWGACHGNVWQQLVEPGVEQVGDGRFRLTTEPAVGEHSWRRLQGCLEDTTLDRVKARVISKRDLPPAP
jgi:hypothetical protein